MILEQYYLSCLSQASYLIGDEKTGTAAVVDPRRDVDEYIEDAARAGLIIRYVILTHFHADFVAGHLELQRRTGAKIYLGARATAEYEFTGLRDGDVLEFGDVRLKTLETPGHTPESISILVFDLARDAVHPRAVLTGDTLFVGDVGRPDLMASVGFSAESLAGLLYDSLRKKLLLLPDDTVLYPGHGAGSVCGKDLGAETVSTIGAQRRDNYALQPMSKDEFVRVVTSHQPEAPPYFQYDAALNRSVRPVLEDTLAKEFMPLSVDEVLDAVAAGAQVLDARPPSDFAAGHLRASINISLQSRFATWAGTLLALDHPIVIVAPPGKEREAATRLGRVGFDHVIGYLEGGIDAARGRAPLVPGPARVPAERLGELMETVPITLVDVRAPNEWQAESIPGSRNVPLQQLRERLAEIPSRGPVLVYCRTGERSSTAASLLEAAGRKDILDLAGGITAWKAIRRGAG